jgi:hypothetical protein
MAQMLVSTLGTFRPLAYSYTIKVTPIIGYSSRQETKERNVIGLVSRYISIVIYQSMVMYCNPKLQTERTFWIDVATVVETKMFFSVFV